MTELELGAICFALENAHNFTYGADTIEILTDHSPLVVVGQEEPGREIKPQDNFII